MVLDRVGLKNPFTSGKIEAACAVLDTNAAILTIINVTKSIGSSSNICVSCSSVAWNSSEPTPTIAMAPKSAWNRHSTVLQCITDIMHPTTTKTKEERLFQNSATYTLTV